MNPNDFPYDMRVPTIGVLVGELLAIDEDGGPLVRFSGRAGSAVVSASTCVDLHAQHIGAEIVLMFDGGDEGRPIVVGVLRGRTCWPLENRPGAVEVDVDGQRMVIKANEQLVLRCGKASITLTKAGKVMLQGSYVSSRSSGVNRIRGGSIQLN